MAEKDNTPESGISGPVDAHSVIFELWERCAGNLNDSELEWFARAGEWAGHVAHQLEQTVEGVGCLIANEAHEDGKTTSGNFQNARDLPALLFSITHSISQIRGLIHVSDSATHRLLNPGFYAQLDSHSKTVTG